MISLGRCPWSRPTSTEFSNRTLSRMRGLLSRPLEDEAQVKAEVQEKESRSVQQSMAKLNLGVSRATREGIRKIGRLDRRGGEGCLREGHVAYALITLSKSHLDTVKSNRIYSKEKTNRMSFVTLNYAFFLRC